MSCLHKLMTEETCNFEKAQEIECNLYKPKHEFL